jgi:phenylacetyl-CoA:acceptor oxidoreductase subunit 2
MSTLVPGRVASWRQTYWDWRAAGNFAGGGSGTGVLLYAAVVSSTALSLGLLGAALISGGLLCVWFEIGRPWRALNVFRRANSSWMTREAIIAPLLLASGLGGAWYGSRPLLWLSGALALAYLYCQARMLNGGRGIPAWRHPRLVPLLLVTGLAEGSGLGVLIQLLLEPDARLSWTAWLLVGLLLARVLAFVTYRSGLIETGAPRRALEELARFGRAFVLIDALAAAAAALGTISSRYVWLLGAAGLMCAAAGWWLKYTIVVRAAFNQGFALPMTPVRGSGTTHAGARPGW